jgi:hypothetical protein
MDRGICKLSRIKSDLMKQDSRRLLNLASDKPILWENLAILGQTLIVPMSQIASHHV